MSRDIYPHGDAYYGDPTYRLADELPAWLSLPSGLKLRLDQIWRVRPIEPTNPKDWGDRVRVDVSLLPSFDSGAIMTLYGADAYALHAALSRFGYEADAPTLKGDDADGDGKVGE